jgi:hypothetical protein
VVNSSSPIGPRAWSLSVLIPISAPKPNSPPSLKRVETFQKTAAESTAARNRRAAGSSAVTMVSLFTIFRYMGDYTGVPWLGTFKPLWLPAWFGSAFNIPGTSFQIVTLSACPQ